MLRKALAVPERISTWCSGRTPAVRPGVQHPRPDGRGSPMYCALIICLAFTFALNAAETNGKFVEYDTAKKELTVDVNGAKSRFTLTDDVKIVTAGGEATKKG